MNNYSNKSYLSIQILAKERALLSKLKALCDLRIIKCTFSKKYNQNGIKPITYVDDINLSSEYIRDIRRIKLSRSNNPDLYSIKWVFSDAFLLIYEKYDEKNIAKYDRNNNEQIITTTTRAILSNTNKKGD